MSILRLRDLPEATTGLQLIFATLAVAIALLIRVPFEPALAGAAPYATFFVAILLVAWFCRIAATVWAVALSFATVGFAVIPPAWTFDIADPSQGYTLLVFLLIATSMVALSRAANRARHETLRALEMAARAQRGAQAAVWDVELDRMPVSLDAWPRMLGVSDGDATPAPAGLAGRVHPDDQGPTRAILEAALRAPQSFSTEFRVEHPRLGERWLVATGDVVRDDQGRRQRLAGITLDITERKRSESERELLASIVQSSDDAIVAKNLESTILSWNLGAERLFGYPAEEVVGRSIEILIPSERRGEEREILDRIRRGERIEQFETVRLTRAGAPVEVSLKISPIRDHRGRIIGASKVARDIGDRKRAERALASQREWFRVTLTSIGDGVITVDRQGRVTFVNPPAETLIGLSAAECGGKPLRDVLHIVDERTRQPIETPTEKVIRTGRIFGLADHTVLIARDGTERPIADSAAPIYDDAGAIIGAVLVFRDVTEERRAEAERTRTLAERERLLESERVARAEAERANRLKDEFVATLSHELRTPLNAILGWTQVARTAEVDAPTLSHAIDVIERNARAQAQLVSDLLDISLITAGRLQLQLQTLDPSEVVRAALDAVRSSAEAKQIRIDADLPAGVEPVVADAARLEQILWNLLSNAIKFTPVGGSVDVVLRERDDHVEVVVRDSGIGIDADFLPHLFERFRQRDGSFARRFGGLGLGLAIVKQLSDLHGAEVFAESEGADRGATFTLRLPRSTGPTAAATPAIGEPTEELSATRLDGLHVLVVEDDADTRELVRRLLEDAGARVTAATDARRALEALRDEIPDLLLSDIGLPGTDGFELLRRIRAQLGSALPAIAITAFARAEDRTRAMAAGYQSYLVKPVDPRELIATIRSFADLVRRDRRSSS